MHMVDPCFRQFGAWQPAAAIWIVSIPRVFWPYFAGVAVLAIGTLSAVHRGARQPWALDKIVQFGPVFFAIPLAIFGADHFIAAKFVAEIVPQWIPAHLFWVYFVGVALIAAALSLAANKVALLAATLLGIMLFLFVLLIHAPACFATPHDKTRLTILLRDMALSAGALAFATSQSSFGRGREEQRRRGDGVRAGFRGLRVLNLGTKVLTLARFAIAITVTVFGFEHFLDPEVAPGIPQESPTVAMAMPSWIPGHVFWAYVTGAILLACGVSLIANRQARFAATVLGLTLLVLTLFVYVPLMIAKPSDIGNGLNYVAIHFVLAGAALLLAGALPKTVPVETDVTSSEKAELRHVSEP
jgi:uncharacterized membrane protein